MTGINIYHDEWFCPMSETTSAIFEIARTEAPDMLLDLHSHQGGPDIDIPSYVPSSTRIRVYEFISKFSKGLSESGYVYSAATGLPGVEDETNKPLSFNLESALYHSGIFMPVLFESPHGFGDQKILYDYHELLEINAILIETAADYLLS